MSVRQPLLLQGWLSGALCVAACAKPALPSADANSTAIDPPPAVAMSAPALSSPRSTPFSTVLRTDCADPRKTMCTKIYAPVCADVDTGIRCIRAPCPSSQQKTYGNPCEACADPKVLGWYRGVCEGG